MTFIQSMGATEVAEKLPPLLDAMRRDGRRVLWVCDPMHGNTESTSNGYKTRRFRNIRAEIETSFELHAAAGTRMGGVHLELTGEDVTECLGGARELTESDLDRAYRRSRVVELKGDRIVPCPGFLRCFARSFQTHLSGFDVADRRDLRRARIHDETHCLELSGSGVHGVCFAEVEVDVETGHVRPIKMVHVQDIGLPLNRLAIESQINGGMIQSLGMVLWEERVMDANLGIQVNPNFGDYKLPGSAEIPELVAIIDDEDKREAVIGVGEPAIIPSVGALANAVFNAAGVRVPDLPITPDKLLMALTNGRKS